VECVALSRRASGIQDGIRCLQHPLRGGATRTTHYCSRTFENAVWSAHGVYGAPGGWFGSPYVYLTVPFVLFWSLLNALACECMVLAYDTAPVRDVVRHGEKGLLGDFFDVDGLAASALQVLRDPATFRPLAAAGRVLIEAHYDLARSAHQHWSLFERILATRLPDAGRTGDPGVGWEPCASSS
jgi:hypothetical protein